VGEVQGDDGMTDHIKQRYLAHIKKDKTRFGTEVLNPVNKFEFPTESQMDAFDKYHIPYSVDPALRDPVIALNAKGYTTYVSCQGHTKGSTGIIWINPHISELTKEDVKEYPFILSRKPINPTEIKKILQRFGINVKKYNPAKHPVQPQHGFRFPGIVGYKSMFGYKR
jgi:hypothetical protein